MVRVIRMIRDILLWIEVETLDRKFFGIGVLFTCLLVSCGVKDIQRPFTADHANRLLSGDDTKRWNLNSRIADDLDVVDPCITNNELIFVKADAGDSLYILGQPVGCNSSDEIDTLYKAKYELEVDEEEAFNSQILLTDERKAVIRAMTVERLTSSELRLLYSVDGVNTREVYSQE